MESTLPTSVTVSQELAAALVEAQGRVGWVGKDGENRYHHYNYATAESVIDAARAALNESGLMVFHSWSSERYDVELKSTPDVKYATGRVVVSYVVIHKSGAALAFSTTTPVVPEKGRPEDKAEQAALTSNLAYSLRGLLLIPRGEAPEESVDGRDDTAAPRTEAPVDVPFMSAEERVRIGNAPVAVVDDPWRDVIEAQCKDIDAAGTVGAILAGLVRADNLAMPSYALTRVRCHALRRAIEVAATSAELASAVKTIGKPAASKSWHTETGRLYSERSTALRNGLESSK